MTGRRHSLLTVLRQLERDGFDFLALPTGEVLVAPISKLPLDLRQALASQRTVLWRVLEMRRLARMAPRALPYARESACGGPGRCFSCGDALERSDAFGRCSACDLALEIYYTTLEKEQPFRPSPSENGHNK